MDRNGKKVLGGRYCLLKPLNHGSYGTVNLAHDHETSKTVAVKSMYKQGPSADMAATEIRLHQSIKGSHPNVVGFLDSLEIESHTLIVLEYCALGDLYEAILNGRGPGETEHVRKCILQLIDAVEFVHAQGIYHRDIKPENILMETDGNLKLADFGLSTREAWTEEKGVGSERYMPPEAFDADQDSPRLVSPAKADYWALGITLLNMLFSRNPFKTASAADPLWNDYVRDKETLYDVFPSISPDTFHALLHVLSPNPDKRDLGAFREAILQVQEWTTTEICEDDFACDESGEPVATTENRQPLQTPSIHPTGKSFPWATALSQHTPVEKCPSAQEAEELSQKLEALTPPSVDSGIGASVKSFAMHVMPLTEESISMPVRRNQLRDRSHKSHLHFAKSWSDYVEEQEEEEARRLTSSGSTSSPNGSKAGSDFAWPLSEHEEDWLPQWEV